MAIEVEFLRTSIRTDVDPVSAIDPGVLPLWVATLSFEAKGDGGVEARGIEEEEEEGCWDGEMHGILAVCLGSFAYPREDLV